MAQRTVGGASDSCRTTGPVASTGELRASCGRMEQDGSIKKGMLGIWCDRKNLEYMGDHGNMTGFHNGMEKKTYSEVRVRTDIQRVVVCNVSAFLGIRILFDLHFFCNSGTKTRNFDTPCFQLDGLIPWLHNMTTTWAGRVAQMFPMNMGRWAQEGEHQKSTKISQSKIFPKKIGLNCWFEYKPAPKARSFQTSPPWDGAKGLHSNRNSN